MNFREKQIENIVSQINDMNTDDLVQLNNEYGQSCSLTDDEIFSNDEEFFEMFFNGNVMEAVRAVSYGDYQFQHDYVKFDGYGNLVSFDRFAPDDLIGSVEDIAEDVVDDPSNYSFDFEFLEEDEDEEEEEENEEN